MKNKDNKLDELLENNTQQQLQKIDWERLNKSIVEKIETARQHPFGQTKRIYKLKIASVAAVAACLVISFSLVFRFTFNKQDNTGQIAGSDMAAGVLPEDSLLASTNPDLILLTGKLHFLENDPLLKPHSIWQQQNVSKNRNHNLRNGG